MFGVRELFTYYNMMLEKATAITNIRLRSIQTSEKARKEDEGGSCVTKLQLDVHKSEVS